MEPSNAIKHQQVDVTENKLPKTPVLTHLRSAALGLVGLLSVSCVSTYPPMNYGGPVQPIYHQPYGQMSTADLYRATEHQKAVNKFQRESIKGQRDYQRAMERQQEARFERMMQPLEDFEDAVRNAERIQRRMERLSRN